MTEQEAKDIETLKAEQIRVKVRLMDYALHSLRNGIEHSGHKTIENLVLYCVKDCQKQLDKLEKAHLTKYPD